MSLRDDLRGLYKEGHGWKEFFDALAGYTNRVTETKAERAKEQTGLGYDTIILGMRKLDELEVGEFKYGRRGGSTRIVWNYSPRSVGRVAQGKQEHLDSYAEDELMQAAEKEDHPPAPLVLSSTPSLLIDQAKQALADQLGIAPEQIEIVIRW